MLFDLLILTSSLDNDGNDDDCNNDDNDWKVLAGIVFSIIILTVVKD